MIKGEIMKKIRRVFLFLFSLSIYLTAGCIGPLIKSKPAEDEKCPDVPTGPKLSAMDAFNFSMKQLDSYKDKNFILPPTLLGDGPSLLSYRNCSWIGNDKGNCSSWGIHINGIYMENDLYYLLRYEAFVGYNNNNIISSDPQPPYLNDLTTSIISNDQINGIMNEINETRIDFVFTNDSYQIYPLAEEIRGPILDKTCISHLNIYLTHTNYTYNGEPFWTIDWKYECKDNESKCKRPTSQIDISAIDGRVLFTKPI